MAPTSATPPAHHPDPRPRLYLGVGDWVGFGLGGLSVLYPIFLRSVRKTSLRGPLFLCWLLVLDHFLGCSPRSLLSLGLLPLRCWLTPLILGPSKELRVRFWGPGYKTMPLSPVIGTSYSEIIACSAADKSSSGVVHTYARSRHAAAPYVCRRRASSGTKALRCLRQSTRMLCRANYCRCMVVLCWASTLNAFIVARQAHAHIS